MKPLVKKHITGFLLVAIFLSTCGCALRHAPSLSKSEKQLILSKDSLMRVYTIDNKKDSLLLRRKSRDFSPRDLKSDYLQLLANKMLATVTSPEQNGVGIAGPQVGLNRRVVAVQRFDKEGEPFEVYFNIYLQPATQEMACGGEGCLSVPERYGQVNRYRAVFISYTDPETLQEVQERVEGFTAVIFQHEVDHLEGVLYIDKLEDK